MDEISPSPTVGPALLSAGPTVGEGEISSILPQPGANKKKQVFDMYRFLRSKLDI